MDIWTWSNVELTLIFLSQFHHSLTLYSSRYGRKKKKLNGRNYSDRLLKAIIIFRICPHQSLLITRFHLEYKMDFSLRIFGWNEWIMNVKIAVAGIPERKKPKEIQIRMVELNRLYQKTLIGIFSGK